MDYQIFLMLLLPLSIDISTIWLSFLSWYEREIKYKGILLISFIISSILCVALWFFYTIIPLEYILFYRVIITSIFFLMFPQLYLLVIWIRKGSQRGFLLLAVSAYIASLWLILPIGYSLIPSISLKGKILADYITGVILGTLFAIGIIEEVRPKDGYITASAATAALSVSDAVSKYIYNFAIFTDITIQIAILVASSLLSFFLYKRATD